MRSVTLTDEQLSVLLGLAQLHMRALDVQRLNSFTQEYEPARMVVAQACAEMAALITILRCAAQKGAA